MEEAADEEAAEEGVGERRRQAVEGAPLHPPFLDAFSALRRSLYTKPNQFTFAVAVAVAFHLHLPLFSLSLTLKSEADTKTK